LYFLGSSTAGDFQFCDVQGDSSGFVGPVESMTYLNNIAQDPMFALGQAEPYRLLENSPCIDAGTPDSSNYWLTETDIVGNDRVQNGRVDMGAYEGPSTTDISPTPLHLPRSSKLYANYPNPFNPSTTISYDVSQAGRVQLKIYNTLGQMVKKLVDAQQNAGSYKLHFKADGLASGMYFYQLKIGSFEQTRKMLLLR